MGDASLHAADCRLENPVTKESFHVVVVGAGSSGGVAAARLSEDSDRSVLLLEAGTDFPNELEVPPAFLAGGNILGENYAGAGAAVPDLDWDYWSEPVADERRVHLWRGRMVGGTSMVNGCVAVRGKPSDFDRWEEAGASGWAWEDVRPPYEAVEERVPIKRYPPEQWQPVQHLFVESYKEIGFRPVDDMNKPESWDGVIGAWPQNRRNEVRQGTLVTYIRDARPRANFTIRGRTLVDRVLIRDGRARGVRVVSDDGQSEEISAHVVVLSAGAYGSPAILLRSGIGPADELRRVGIEPIADLPVGRNLRDHPQCFFYLGVPSDQATMSGPGFAVVARGEGWWCFPLALDEEAGICAFSYGLASEDSSGTVALSSSDPTAKPLIDHRYRDVISRNEFEHAYSTFVELCETRVLRSIGARNTDAGLSLEHMLAERLGTAFHPAGTCAIGSVVDPHLRVLGLENLLVADASIFPLHVTNNPNLTCLMVGERVAAFVAERESAAARS